MTCGRPQVKRGKEVHQLSSDRQELRNALSDGPNSIRSFSPLQTDPASGTLSSFGAPTKFTYLTLQNLK